MKKERNNQINIFYPQTPLTKNITISLRQINSKKISKIDSCTMAGYISTGQQKINQDKFFIKKEFLGQKEQFLLGICDGHGAYGHLVSDFISKT